MEELFALLLVAAWLLLRKGSSPSSQPDEGSAGGPDYYSPLGDDSNSEGMGMTLMDAIARMEGFLVPGSRAARNHNPGNIVYGPFAIENGATGSDGRFAIFPDDATGFTALKNLLVRFYSGLTLTQAINKYAPSNENDTGNYISNVSQWTGLGPDDLIDPALNG